MHGRLDLLSPMERRVLLSLFELGDQKAVARELGIGPETVKTHLRKARAKTGATGSFALAREVATEAGHTPIRGMPRDGGARLDRSRGITPSTAGGSGEERTATELREAPARFDLDDPAVASKPASESGVGGSLPRMIMAAILVILVSAAMLLAFPLSESFQRLADRLDPPRH